MEIRQYIGARYVPKFSDVNDGEWDNTYTYEALEIVKHGNDYYTAKKPVPTGIAITNTEYWVPTGNYSGAIAGLDARLSSVESDVEDLEDDVSDIKQIVNRQGLVVFGDSWSASSVSDSVWPSLVANALGLSLHNYAKNGAGFTNGTFQTELDDFAADTSYDKQRIKYVIILTGVNDIYTRPVSTGTQEAAYMKTFIDGLYNSGLDRSVPIYHFINFTFGANTISAASQYNYWNVYKKAILTNNYNLSVFQIHTWFNVNDMNTGDFFHLTRDAQTDTLAPNIIGVLNGIMPNPKPTFATDINFDDNGTSRTISLYLNWCDDKIEVSALIPASASSKSFTVTLNKPAPFTLPAGRFGESCSIQITSDGISPGTGIPILNNRILINYTAAQTGSRWVCGGYNFSSSVSNSVTT